MNDNDSVPGSEPPLSTDAHGHAALLLVESLIHGLCENDTLSQDKAVEIAERAVDVQSEHVETANGTGSTMQRSHALLSSIAASLRTDGAREPTAPRPQP